MDKLWPDNLEAKLQVLVGAAILKAEQLALEEDQILFAKAEQWVEELFTFKLWIVIDNDGANHPQIARASMERWFEILYEREMKLEPLDPLRKKLMTHLFVFEKPDHPLPKSRWLADSNTRSPAFQWAYTSLRREMILEGDFIPQVDVDGVSDETQSKDLYYTQQQQSNNFPAQ